MTRDDNDGTTTDTVAPQSDPATDTTTGADDPDTVDTDDPDTGDDNQGETGGRRNREAQYRRRAQTAEAERDQLRDQLQAVQRQQVDEMARTAGIDPRLLVAAGHELSALVAEDGTVNRDAVTTALDAARDEFLPAPGRIGTGRRPTVNPQQGEQGGVVGRVGIGPAIAKALGR